MLTEEQILERHQMLVEFQEKVFPMTATIRQMGELWGLESTASTRNTLNLLIERELVTVHGAGNYHRYYAQPRRKDYVRLERTRNTSRRVNQSSEG